MNDEQAIDARARVLAAGYVAALWLVPDERFLPPGAADRTVTLQEALAEIENGSANEPLAAPRPSP